MADKKWNDHWASNKIFFKIGKCTGRDLSRELLSDGANNRPCSQGLLVIITTKEEARYNLRWFLLHEVSKNRRALKCQSIFLWKRDEQTWWLTFQNPLLRNVSISLLILKDGWQLRTHICRSTKFFSEFQLSMSEMYRCQRSTQTSLVRNLCEVGCKFLGTCE